MCMWVVGDDSVMFCLLLREGKRSKKRGERRWRRGYVTWQKAAELAERCFSEHDQGGYQGWLMCTFNLSYFLWYKSLHLPEFLIKSAIHTKMCQCDFIESKEMAESGQPEAELIHRSRRSDRK